MVRLNKIYTKTGDAGKTGLSDGSRLSKHALRIHAIGSVDEANSAIGLARLDAEGDTDAMLARIQNDLFDLGADLSTPEKKRGKKPALRITGSQVERLEREIDAMNVHLAPLKSFVLPGGTMLAARLHLARAITRRAERDAVALGAKEKLNPAALKYLNRLSDHLFVMARAANDSGMGDVLWVPGSKSVKANLSLALASLVLGMLIFRWYSLTGYLAYDWPIPRIASHLFHLDGESAEDVDILETLICIVAGTAAAIFAAAWAVKIVRRNIGKSA